MAHAPDSAVAIAADVRAGRRSARAIAESCLADIAARDPAFNAFTAVLGDQALADADAIDAALGQGRDPGPLAGVPFAAKNLFDIAGLTTLAGSKILADDPPAARDATLVARLKAAGAVLVGALNMDEFAYGFSTENAHYGPCRNPHDPERICGGSSGGSAAAVAAGLVPLTIGSDTNGSIRVPAALCGVFGLKPTYGRLSRAGVFPFVDSFDHVGPFARTTADLEAAFAAIDGPDNADPVSQPAPAPAVDDQPWRDLSIGVLDGWFTAGGMDEALAVVETVAAAFRHVRRMTLPGAEAARSAAFCITASEGAALHRHRLVERPFDFDPATRDRLLAGLMLPAEAVHAARRVRRAFQAEVRAAFENVDVLLAPTTPCAATRIGQATVAINGRDVPVRANLGLYTQPISFIGLPVIAAPVAGVPGMPLGVQLIASPWREGRLFAVCRGLEAAGVLRAPQLPR
jgi:aspartyl-tRNA(Asn)/glutamyl-tRNA(Gln) amidotransferase subunit A